VTADTPERDIASMVDDRRSILEPATLDSIPENLDNRNAVAFLVEVATRPTKAIRIKVMLPQDLVDAIDRTTKNHSRFLAKAARSKLRHAG
jgi:hypothetical protein